MKGLFNPRLLLNESSSPPHVLEPKISNRATPSPKTQHTLDRKQGKNIHLMMCDEAQARQPSFGDDYIPLLCSEEEWTHEREKNIADFPQLSGSLIHRKDSLSNPAGHMVNTLKEDTSFSGLVTPSTSEMDVRMGDVGSGDSSAFNATTSSNPNQHVQTANQLAETSVDDLRSIDLCLPSLIAQVIASARAGERERSSRMRLASISSQPAPVDLDVCEVRSSASQVIDSPSTQCSNETSVNSIVHAPPARQPRRLAASDLIMVSMIQTKGNPSHPTSL